VRSTGVRFTTSRDGTLIAYRSIGRGPPLVAIHNFTISHIELEFEVPSFRSDIEMLAEHHEVVRLDPRGTGLSGPTTPRPTVDDVTADVVAVADALELDTFSLRATGTMAPVGVRLGSTDRVSRLVLNDPEIDVLGDEALEPQLRAGEAMREAGVGEHIAAFWAAAAPADDVKPLKALVEANLRGHLGTLTQLLAWNARPWLRSVTAPTLITYTQGDTCGPQAREAAASIPGARLVSLGGVRWAQDRDDTIAALGSFLGWEAGPSMRPSISIVVFTDIVASTELVDRLGDQAARKTIREVEERVTGAAAAHSGKVIKQLGDGSLLEFQAASDALEFARSVRADLRDGTLQIRVGMAAGEPIREEGDLHGAVVVLASRINAAAPADAVCVSDGVRQLVIGKPYEFDDLGERRLKGFDQPVRMWQLRS